jgi:hypothetical protein
VPPASVGQPTAVPGEVVAPDVAVGRQPAAESAGVVARRLEAAAGPVAAAAVRLRGARVAAPDAEEAPQRAAQAEVRVSVAVAPRRVGRDAAPGVLLSAAAWAAPLSTRFQEDRLVPSPPARSAHVRESLRIAQP